MRPMKFGFSKKRKTFDDSEPVISEEKAEALTDPSKVKPRSRTALEVFDEKAAAEAEYDDPLFDS